MLKGQSVNSRKECAGHVAGVVADTVDKFENVCKDTGSSYFDLIAFNLEVIWKTKKRGFA